MSWLAGTHTGSSCGSRRGEPATGHGGHKGQAQSECHLRRACAKHRHGTDCMAPGSMAPPCARHPSWDRTRATGQSRPARSGFQLRLRRDGEVAAALRETKGHQDCANPWVLCNSICLAGYSPEAAPLPAGSRGHSSDVNNSRWFLLVPPTSPSPREEARVSSPSSPRGARG